MLSWFKPSLLLFLATAVLADVAPDPGYTNVSADLVLETDGDLSAYRFFIESPLKIEEIRVLSGAATRIEADGRVGAAKVGKLIAVPAADMRTISGDLSGALLDSMIRENRFPNAKVLLSHYFQATIRASERSSWSDPVYRVREEGGQIYAEPIAVAGPSGGRLTYSVWQFVWPVSVAATLLAIGLTIAGLWLLRRKKKVL